MPENFSLLPPPAPPVPEASSVGLACPDRKLLADSQSPTPLSGAAGPLAAAQVFYKGQGTGDVGMPVLPMLDFAGLWQSFRRNWWIPALGAVLVMGGVAGWLMSTPPLYTAVAELAVEQQSSNVLPGESFKPEDLKSLEILKSIERELTGQGLLLRVAAKHRLWRDPAFGGKTGPDGALADDEMVARFRKRVTATLERGTRHIVVTVDHPVATTAQELCVSILQEATQQNTGTTSDAARFAQLTLEEEKNRIEASLAVSQKAVDAFRSRFPNLPLEDRPSEVKTNPVEEAVRSLEAAASAAAAEVNRLENTVAQIRDSAGGQEALLGLPDIGQREEVVSLKRSLGEKQAAFIVMDAEYGPKHPRHQQAVKELAETSAQLQQAVSRASATMENRLEKARQDASGLNAALAQRKQENVGFQKISGEFATLASLLRAERLNYDRVLSRLKEAETNTALGNSILRVVDPPLKPTKPSKPRRILLTAAGGVMGAGLGLGLVLILHFLDRTVRSVPAGERLLGLPALAVLPLAPVPHPGIPGRSGAPTVPEAFRSLRTALGLLGKGSAARTFLFTSARHEEGTSYIAMNYAASLATQGYRTLLIDANLRQPALAGLLLPQRPVTGLADYLSGSGVRDASACQKTGIPQLYVFAAGTPSRHPGEILNEQSFALLLRDACRWFHRIVIDTPPVGLYPDALPAARHVDAVCLVMRAGVTPGQAAVRAIQKLQVASVRPLGFILNAADPQAFGEENGRPFRFPSEARPAPADLVASSHST